MSAPIIIDRTDGRFATLSKGFNLRWPRPGHGADRIYICDTADAVRQAANDALSRGYRITVRSGGHCYEGLVSDKLPADGTQRLAIIDLGLMGGMDYDEDGGIRSLHGAGGGYRFRIATGNQNWDGYVALYKKANRTIPGGSCYSVGAGGHISGGGFGLLSRLHGLTVDWLSAVDILVPAADGKSLVPKHVHLGSAPADRELFIACRGAGGGNFGILLNYYFHDLPRAPAQVYQVSLTWSWDQFSSAEQLGRLLQAYWQWFKDNDADWNSADRTKANGGLFAVLKIQHRSTGAIALRIQYTGTDGTVDDLFALTPLVDFINHMAAAAPGCVACETHEPWHGPAQHAAGRRLDTSNPLAQARRMDWLHATQTSNGSGANQNGKYKSFHQIEAFSRAQVDTLWTAFNVAGVAELNQALLQIDSYGGCINAHDEVRSPTAVAQRHSLFKAQLQVYWKDAKVESACLAWIRDFYTRFFADEGGKPHGGSGRYEGCYINYPDVDMKYLDTDHRQVDPRWVELYYGANACRLVQTKNAVDPLDIFRSELSIPLRLQSTACSDGRGASPRRG